MSTLLLTHPACLDHQVPLAHPERPDRLRAIDRILEHERFHALERESAPLGSMEDLLRVHSPTYLDRIRSMIPTEGLSRIDEETSVSAGSWEAALRACGAACLAVDEVLENKVTNAFCAVRPPGHHAEREKAMGFCLFNNTAIAARYAQSKFDLKRVAIVDFDVHHGNGIQDIFWTDPTVMYCSSHQGDFYPGTGSAPETGVANTIVNAPLPAGSDGKVFREAYETLILPRLRDFQPELVILAAGFDAHVRDPVGELALTEADFGWVTRKLMDVAGDSCDGRLISVLEGGYDLEALARSVAAHVMTLMTG